MRALLQGSTWRRQALELPSVGSVAGCAEEFHAWEQENTGPRPRDLDLELPPSPHQPQRSTPELEEQTRPRKPLFHVM